MNDKLKEAFDRERCKKEWEEGGEEKYYEGLAKEGDPDGWKKFLAELEGLGNYEPPPMPTVQKKLDGSLQKMQHQFKKLFGLQKGDKS